MVCCVAFCSFIVVTVPTGGSEAVCRVSPCPRTVVAAAGIIVHVGGPSQGRGTDVNTLNESGLIAKMRAADGTPSPSHILRTSMIDLSPYLCLASRAFGVHESLARLRCLPQLRQTYSGTITEILLSPTETLFMCTSSVNTFLPRLPATWCLPHTASSIESWLLLA